MPGALSVPDKKLVADLLFGVLKGGDGLVSDIARALNEGNTLGSAEVRLTNAMKRFDYAALDDAIQKRVFGIFSDPYSLAVDESDIGKEPAGLSQPFLLILEHSGNERKEGRDTHRQGRLGTADNTVPW